MEKKTKALDRRRKSVLDQYTLEFNHWAERVLSGVYEVFPKAQVPLKQLMIHYATGMFYKDIIKHYCQRYSTQTGLPYKKPRR